MAKLLGIHRVTRFLFQKTSHSEPWRWEATPLWLEDPVMEEGYWDGVFGKVAS